jgi:hypothetical protein
MITTTLELALAVLSAEFALLALVFATLLWRGGRRQQAAAVASVSALVSNVTHSEAPRREALLAVLHDTYRFDGEQAQRVVSDFIEREQAFYNMLIGVHLGRGGKTLADVPAEVTRLVAPWLRLMPKGTTDEAAVAALESQNTALNAELAETKLVLDDLMNEYSAAFLRGGEKPMLDLDEDDLGAVAEVAPPPPAPPPEPEDKLVRTANGLRNVPGDQLLSMDEYDSDAPLPRTSPAERTLDDGALDDFGVDLGFGQNVIDLDGDEGPALEVEPLPMSSEDDLDALMQNLGLDPLPASGSVRAA